MRAELTKKTRALKLSSELLAQTVRIQYLQDENPTLALQSGRIMSIAWANSLRSEERQASVQSFMYLIVDSFWKSSFARTGIARPMPDLFSPIDHGLNPALTNLAQTLGISASKIPVEQATAILGSIYSNLVDEATRTKNGVFYTPLPIVHRLLTLIEEQQVEWSSVRVLDPACGSGAFLVPIILKVGARLKQSDTERLLTHIGENIRGYEVDPFAAWLSQVFCELAIREIIVDYPYPFPRLISVRNSLETAIQPSEKFHVVLGNPPYGKVKVDERMKEKYKDGLFGHVNLYGLFFQLAVDLVRKGGVIGYVTPTSFLAGEYFKKLRGYLRGHTNPVSIEFIEARKGVFDEVLQEASLSVYRKSNLFVEETAIGVITALDNGGAVACQTLGTYSIFHGERPWLIPREAHQVNVLKLIENAPARLRDWGYEVSTGQLVWNRHKEQLFDSEGVNRYPIIWPESINSDGSFTRRAERKNHKQFCRVRAHEPWLITDRPCVLLQRTTSKEQSRRLVASILPGALIKKYNGVVVENHINIIRPIATAPAVSLKVLNAFLNSKIADDIFRCISGSVAVSAYELESIPLPPVYALRRLTEMVNYNAGKEEIEGECVQLYRIINE